MAEEKNAKGTMKQFRPSGKLLMRYYLETTTLYIIGAATLLIIFILTLGEEEEGSIAILLILAIVTVVWLVLFVFLKLWIDSFRYEFTENEVIVKKGWITKSKKIVPYRTITNFHRKRGPFDRIMGLATMEIETAGRSGSQSGPEEKMEGILAEEINQFIELVQSKVKHLKGTAAITHDGDVSEKVMSSTDEILLKILAQLKEMNK
jgi:uncharacterized membrane protein YdbT with pleckstrin-like domain